METRDLGVRARECKSCRAVTPAWMVIVTIYVVTIYGGHIKTHGSVSCGPRSRRATP